MIYVDILLSYMVSLLKKIYIFVMIIKENYSIYNSKKIYNFSFVWSRIKQSVRAICKKFFSGLGKIQNKTLEQKTNIRLEADFFFLRTVSLLYN